jgi:hypothetical protein
MSRNWVTNWGKGMRKECPWSDQKQGRRCACGISCTNLHVPVGRAITIHNGTALRTFRTRGPRSDDLLARIIVWVWEKSSWFGDD